MKGIKSMLVDLATARGYVVTDDDRRAAQLEDVTSEIAAAEAAGDTDRVTALRKAHPGLLDAEPQALTLTADERAELEALREDVRDRQSDDGSPDSPEDPKSDDTANQARKRGTK